MRQPEINHAEADPIPIAARLACLCELVDVAIWETDARWRTSFANERMAALLGLSVASLIGRHVLYFVFAEDRTETLTRMRAAEAGEDTGGELRLRRDDGGEVRARLRSRSYLDLAGHFRGAVAVLEAEDSGAATATTAASRQTLAQQLMRAREQESTRIAREIHDELGQALTGLKMDIAWLGRRVEREAPATLTARLRERLANMAAAVDATVLTTRRICAELRPNVLDDLGLVAALEWQAREFEKRTGISVAISQPARLPAPAAEHATALFRILQEILTNVARHAGARRVRIALDQADGIMRLLVSDDGKGFGAGSGGGASLGILGMRERAALCGGTVEFEHGGGTTVRVYLPLHPAHAGEAS